MGIRFPIGRAGALASHGQMIGEKALCDKHFCCCNRRFLCIILRNAHSFSFALPQPFPQARQTIHSGGRWAPRLCCADCHARRAREGVVDSLGPAGYMSYIILRCIPRVA
jgi:hypothetical protein